MSLPYNGITFNGKNSLTDFGLWVEEKSIEPPSKVKILESVPYMHSKYDFSTVGSSGKEIFDTRTITVKFALICYTREEVYTVYSQILEWLMDCGQSKLMFDFMPDFYFLARVDEAPKLEEFVDSGDLEINFICEPFKISTSYMGDDIWDTFNFLTDYTQYTYTFKLIDGGQIINMYNNGRLITPVINVDTPMKFAMEGSSKIYTLNVGDNKIWDLKLKNGINYLGFQVMNAEGIGTVKIIFRWESL